MISIIEKTAIDRDKPDNKSKFLLDSILFTSSTWSVSYSIRANFSDTLRSAANKLSDKFLYSLEYSYSFSGSTLLSLTIEIVNSKAFCAAVAVVLCKLISSISNKKVKIKKGDRIEEYSNLNAKELAEIIERNQGLDLTVNQDDN